MRCLKTFVIAVLVIFAFGFAWNRAQSQDEPKPQQEQQDTKPPKTDKDQVEKPQQDQVKPPKTEKQNDKVQEEQSKTTHQEQEKSQKVETSRGGEHARPAGKSVHIPDEKFRANFGREHTFPVTRVVHETTIVPGRTQFPYGGYTFVILDPWPAGWLVTDECYVDYVDGDYFLFDMLHPGVRVALFVSL